MGFRITGIDTPYGGINWENCKSNKDYIKHLFLYFESKRLLVNSKEMENKDWCIRSALEIKGFLDNISKDIKITKAVQKAFTIFYDTINLFLDRIVPLKLSGIIYKGNSDIESLSFYNAINTFGRQMKSGIEILEKAYNIKFSKEIKPEW